LTEVNIMAIVKTIISGTAVVHIDDSCCAGVSKEEMARRWAEVDRVIWQINQNHARRMAEKEKAAAAAGRTPSTRQAGPPPLSGEAKVPQTFAE
jgi:hypothetical protein